jgi:hypothetical protein
MSVALVIQHAMRRFILPSVACTTPSYFTALSQKRTILGGEVTEYKMCVLTFCTTFVRNISHSMKCCARCHYRHDVREGLGVLPVP